MAKAGIRRAKRIAVVVTFIVAISGLFFSFPYLLKRYLAARAIHYEAIDFSFPCQLTVEGISVRQSLIQARLGQLAIAIKPLSIFSGRLIIDSLRVDRLYLHITDAGTAGGGSSFALPQLVANHISLSAIHISYVSPTDTLQADLAEGKLTGLSCHESVGMASAFFDSLQMSVGLSKTKPDTSPNRPIASLPALTVDSLVFQNSQLTLAYEESKHKFSNLSLQMRGWSTDHLLDFDIHRLGFVYQDSLDLQIVMEGGELSDSLQFDADRLVLELPGLSLHFDSIRVNSAQGPLAGLTLGESHMSFGMLKAVYPDILNAMDENIPNDSMIRFRGQLSIFSDSLLFQPLTISFLSSTSTDVHGAVRWNQEDADFDIEYRNFVSSGPDVRQFLRKESFYEFYTWPKKIAGNVTMVGNIYYFDLRGRLRTTAGKLLVGTILDYDVEGNATYSIDIQSDSVCISQLIDYLPLDVPYADLHFVLGGYYPAGDQDDSLLLQVTSREMAVERFKQQNVHFSFQHFYGYDSILATMDGHPFKGNFKGEYFSGDTILVPFSGKVEYFRPHLVDSILPSGELRSSYTGTYKIMDQMREVVTEANDMTYTAADGAVWPVKPAALTYGWDDDSLRIKFSLDKENTIFATMDDIFDYDTISLQTVAESIEKLHVNFSLSIDSALTSDIFGRPVEIDIPQLKLDKEGKSVAADIFVNRLQWEPYTIDSLLASFTMTDQSLDSDLQFIEFSNPYFPISEASVYVDRANKQWNFGLSCRLVDYDKKVALECEALEDDSLFFLRVKEPSPIVLADTRWNLINNKGIYFDKTGTVQKGTLGIARDSARFYLKSLEPGKIIFVTESFNLDNFSRALIIDKPLSGTINGVVEYDQPTGNIVWQAGLNRLHTDDYQLGNVKSEGSYINQAMAAGFGWTKDTTTWDIQVNGKEDSLWFESSLRDFSLSELALIPSVKENINILGKVNGQLQGNYFRKKLSMTGDVKLKGIEAIVTASGTRMFIPDDHMKISGTSLVLDGLRIYDEQGSAATLQGSIGVHPQLTYQIVLDANAFRVVNQPDQRKSLSGRAVANAHLAVKGSLSSGSVSGTAGLLSNSSIRYIYNAPITITDADQAVSFVEFNELSSNKVTPKRPVRIPIDLDLGLALTNTTVEVIFDEITQEYLRFLSSGKVDIRQKRGDDLVIIGKITSAGGNGYYSPPAVPALNLSIENASIEWDGRLANPLFTFRGIQTIKASPATLAAQFNNSKTPVDFYIPVIVEPQRLKDLRFKFDLSSKDVSVNDFLTLQPAEVREGLALNFLVFGNLSSSTSQSSVVLSTMATKLNEILRRNLKSVDLSFSVNQFQAEDLTTRSDLYYRFSKDIAGNKLQFSLGGELGIDRRYTNRQANFIDNLSISYIIRQKPKISIKANVSNNYRGIFDGDVTKTSVGLNVRSSYPRFIDLFILRRKPDEE